MERIKVNWDAIGISNDFLFGKVMRNAELCRELLQRILPDLAIGRVEYPELQKEIKPDADARSIRLDVYTKDDKDRVFDIEMQMTVTKELPKRSRYYHSMLDLQLIDKGQTYAKLKPSFVIFICLADMFGAGRHKYTFETVCREDRTIWLGEERTTIFLNADSQMEDVSKELTAFLNYAAGCVSEDPFVKKLDEAVKEAKRNREWRREYMTLLMRDQENIEKGRKEGRREGRREGRKEGQVKELYHLVLDGLLPLETAVKRSGLSQEKFLEIAKRH